MSHDNAIESFIVSGLTVNIFPDSDPESPREWDNLGTMVCSHSNYNLGDKPYDEFSDTESFLLSLLSIKEAERLEKLESHLQAKAFDATRGTAYGSEVYRARYGEARDNYRAALQTAAERVAIILPLFLYDHSGITISTYSFADPWDSGQVGFIRVANDTDPWDSDQVGFIYVSLATVRKEYNARAVTAAVRAKAVACMQHEAETYADFLEGNAYGYTVEDADGVELDSCWGFYGFDYCKDAAHDSAAHIAEQVTATLTAAEKDTQERAEAT
jgi:hypothetical protein